MTKSEAEPEVKILIANWCNREVQSGGSIFKVYFPDFKRWLEDNSPGHLNFRGNVVIEQWFDEIVRNLRVDFNARQQRSEQ